MNAFERHMNDWQTNWRQQNISSTDHGEQNRKAYSWIVPRSLWKETIWEGIRHSLPAYLETGIQRHSGSHNLKSSWMLSANLYFPFRCDSGRALLAEFLRDQVDPRIQTVDAVELEYEEPRHSELHPSKLLCEDNGTRGAGQTSPDIGFHVNDYSGLVLTEVKFTEHSFYGCSARRRQDGSDPEKRPGNPDPARCESLTTILADVKTQCHQVRWGRRYWEHLQPVMADNIPARGCPAARTGYQLFRQQALAEGIAASGKYDFVLSCAAIDERNEVLKVNLNSLGWDRLFAGNVRFKIFTHQDWVNWVRAHDLTGKWAGWLQYVLDRYDFAA